MLTYRVDGEGQPLVLLNGGLMSISAWQPFILPLTTRYRVVRCDFRGQLQTPGPLPATWEEHADDVAELLDELRIERAHIAGASFGGEVAMFLGALHPTRVERLTVITATDYTTEEMRRDAAVGLAIAERGDGAELSRRIAAGTWSKAWLARQPPDFIEQRARQIAMLPPAFFAGAAAILRLLDSLDVRPLLPKIAAPALVVGGEHDRIFPVQHSRAIAAAIPNAALEIVPETGHGLLIERADRVIELLVGRRPEGGCP
jgi:pimeloyl-ACP methyl ester carboxylesterase